MSVTIWVSVSYYSGQLGHFPKALVLPSIPYRCFPARSMPLAPSPVQGLGPDLGPDHYSAALQQLLGYSPRLVQLAAEDMEGVWADMKAVAEELKLGREGVCKIQGGCGAEGRGRGGGADGRRRCSSAFHQPSCLPR